MNFSTPDSGCNPPATGEYCENYNYSYTYPSGMKKCLVSGGNGFLGFHLIEKCIENGLEVTVVDNLSTMQSNNIPKKVTFIMKNIEEFDTSDNFDYIVHLAARPSPEDYIAHPVETLMSNSLGTLSMLEIARKSKGVFMYTSSSETYGNASGLMPGPYTLNGLCILVSSPNCLM